MFYSKQKIFCNTCGKGMLVEFPKIIGTNFKVCSSECLSEIKWRLSLSILGSAYESRPDSSKEVTLTEDISIIESI